MIDEKRPRPDAALPFRARAERSAPLDPTVIRLIDALARFIAQEDDARDRAARQPATVEGEIIHD
jgi:hypothetical protein